MATKPSKYATILSRLHLAAPDDPVRQDKIEQVKTQITNRNPIALASNYIELRATKDSLKATLSAIELRIEAHEQLLATSQNAGEPDWGRYGVKPNAIRLATGDTIRIQPEPYGKVLDREQFRLWCIKNGYERQLQLWPSTMNAVVKERLLAGQPEPDGTEAYFYNKIVLVKKGDE